ncbi:helix-turn-helix transcriptional regulator [Moraxella catarrhalis]|uniref:helix-turn-helix transcriptional regulator n=1 Tax=Moraxella catarrhalis TaxID=480 RepID=UPI000202B00A|nr:AlpA family phage regulatory protein [Moraxella catarrhalis]EGE09637.1 prophage CP4-57 regulatory protein AlpA [Moraxella catarrhalis 46P47B1]MCG6835460.1 AlpA family phage regulatory protein [Moraxella catarrhalis]MPW68233.1 AlpA family phage regulatory protein [Moraxella catarrhalis]MPX57155.1 AlpA family phage regulatory protein [Moraxella catarrhalis]RKL71031.1 AlpA family phage regulatory protein [Moraxella catarrhalis]
MTTKSQQPHTLLPTQGMSRAKDILPLLPFGKSTLWQKVKSGKFPQPVRLGKNCTAWRNQDIHDWLADPIAWEQNQ